MRRCEERGDEAIQRPRPRLARLVPQPFGDTHRGAFGRRKQGRRPARPRQERASGCEGLALALWAHAQRGEISMIRKLLIAFGLLFSTAAQAEWYEATSRNFLVYSEGSEQDARDFAAKLERYNFVLRAYHHVTAPPAPNKLRVFLMAGGGDVARMAGAPASSGIAGYYVPTARAQMLVGTRSRRAQHTGSLDPESILLHEYTHHFMYRYFPATYPTWYSEGFAEFWGSTKILPGDVVEVGLPVDYRFDSFFENRWLPMKELLTAQSYADVSDVDLLY